MTKTGITEIVIERRQGVFCFKEGQPVEGATVILLAPSVPPVKFERTTDHEGFAAVWNIRGEGFVIIAEHEGWCAWKTDVNVPEDFPIRFDLTYAPEREFWLDLHSSNPITPAILSGALAIFKPLIESYYGLKVARWEVREKTILRTYVKVSFSAGLVTWALCIITVIGALIALLFVFKWVFGPAAPVVAIVGLGALALFALLLLAPAIIPKRKRPEEVRYA